MQASESWKSGSRAPRVSELPSMGGGSGRGQRLPPHTPPRPRGDCNGLWKLWVTGRGLIRAGRRGPYPGTRPTSPGAPSLPIPLRAKGRQNIPGLPGRGCVSAELHTGPRTGPDPGETGTESSLAAGGLRASHLTPAQ